ncbi:MAG: biopolymer transporter ExbD [Akkermansia sp.]|nr:biopolymer transporter ExbD [Akkermansia sp.]MBQ9096734.1 biopolymer transporter ExbD [Akkermansia sp.]
MGKKERKQEETECKPNMSPMIDCCFLLLIFFVVNATALTVSKDPSVTMPQATKPTDLEDAKGCIVINVFAPDKMMELAKSGSDQEKRGEEARIKKLQESYKQNDITRIHYGVKTGDGKMLAITDEGANATVKKLEEFIKDEKKALENSKTAKDQIRVYIRADARADWKRTYYVITAANNAGVPDIVFGSLPAKK